MKAKAPEILPIFEVYEVEARFGRLHIAADVLSLSDEAKVLEVGAGSLLLSFQLAGEGFDVTALEPLGQGFSHFSRLRELVLECAAEFGITLNLLDLHAEDLTVREGFDYAFSINVMEHVNDVERVITQVGASLRPGASFRFVCPNYLFPYEPHFNIPTILSKKITEQIFKNRIFNNSRLPDPKGTWQSLNWITVPQVNKVMKKLPQFKVSYNRLFLICMLERISSDPEFASRRSGWMRTVIAALTRTKLHLLAGMVPAIFQPAIDCTLLKREI